MIWMCNYLRRCFCKHCYENIAIVETYGPRRISGNDLPKDITHVYRCAICGHVQRVRV